MASLLAAIDTYHHPINAVLTGVIVFFAVACTFHDVVPICDYLFGCDHALHAATVAMAD